MNPSVPEPRHARRRVFAHPGRAAVVAVAMFAVVNLAILALHTSDETPNGTRPLPPSVVSVSPEPGSLAGPVSTVVVDLDQAYPHFDLIIDGIDVQQYARHVDNEISFRPGAGQPISRYRAGENTVVVYFWASDSVVRPADARSFGWTFRVAA